MKACASHVNTIDSPLPQQVANCSANVGSDSGKVEILINEMPVENGNDMWFLLVKL